MIKCVMIYSLSVFSLLFLFTFVKSFQDNLINEPLVAFICGKPTKYFSLENQIWKTDLMRDCIEDPEEILSYCQNKFPKANVSYILPSQTSVVINNWCLFGTPDCYKREHSSHLVKPYRCLSGNFQSDALLVPEHCQFGHQTSLPKGLKGRGEDNSGFFQNDQNVCESYDIWNETAHVICESADRHLQSFGVLFPCKRDMKHQAMYFSGVEYVCCPNNPDDNSQENSVNKQQPIAEGFEIKLPSNDEEGEPTLDDFINYLNGNFTNELEWSTEHARFAKAKTCLQRFHGYRRNLLVKDLAKGETDVETMNKNKMPVIQDMQNTLHTNFRQEYSALLSEQMTQRRELDKTHQQRVSNRLMERTNRATADLRSIETELFTSVANQQDENTINYILKRYTTAMEQLFHSIQKDRIHSINRLDHLRISDPQEALSQMSNIREHLKQLNRKLRSLRNQLETLPMERDKMVRTFNKLENQFKSVDESVKRALSEPIPRQKSIDFLSEADNIIRLYEHIGVQNRKSVNHKEDNDNAIVDSNDLTSNNGHGHGFIVNNLADVASDHENRHEFGNKHGHGGQGGEGGYGHIIIGDKSNRLHLNMMSVVVIVASITLVGIAAIGYCVFFFRHKSCSSCQPTKRGYTLTVLEEEANYHHNTGGYDAEAERLKHMQVNGFENPTYKFFEQGLQK